ncbi:MAG TPA: hypothetical protein VMG10_10760 [Gemmataceae bacterium]|nr:hypothetical protein [Gemmataceae bacterium]
MKLPRRVLHELRTPLRGIFDTWILEDAIPMNDPQKGVSYEQQRDRR